MSHWTNKYVAIPYKKMNCSKFCEFVLKDHFKIDFEFPQSQGTIFNQSNQIKESIPKFSYYPERTDNPEDGDLVLMHGIRLMCHVGLYVKIKNIDYVLHCESGIKMSCLHRLRDIRLIGYSVEGVYKWQK